MTTLCESCTNYTYDELCDCYFCSVNLDEDDMQRFLAGNTYSCSFWQSDDEYEIVKKQI